MKTLLLSFIILFLSGCGQTFNSHTDDFLLGSSSACADPTNTLLCDANAIIQAECTSCHTGYHNDWLVYDTDAKWITSTRVVAGDPDSSLLIQRLQNVGDSMPIGQPQISDDDYQALRTWILAL
jgi:hypothetical protein